MQKRIVFPPYRSAKAVLFLAIAILFAAGCGHDPGKTRPITLPHAAPYETGLQVRPAVRRECDLERRVVHEIASEISGLFSPVQQAPEANAATPGLALDLKIIHVEGKSGWAAGHKILSVAGTLYENGAVVGNFVATRRTKRGRRTCRMLWNNIEEIAEDVSRWLERPSRNAYLGDARPGDDYRSE